MAAVTLDELLEKLQQMKHAGIPGSEIINISHDGGALVSLESVVEYATYKVTFEDDETEIVHEDDIDGYMTHDLKSTEVEAQFIVLRTSR